MNTMLSFFRRYFLLIVLTGASAMLAGCADIDRLHMSRMEPSQLENGVLVVPYIATADAQYPEASPEAEALRMKWLRAWLSQNGYSPDQYTILSRKSVVVSKGLIGSIANIYYKVQVVEIKQ